MRLTWILSIVLALSIAPICSASITGVAGGTDAPGATLGPYFMTPFPDESRTLWVSDVDSPLEGENPPLEGKVLFSSPSDSPPPPYAPLSLRINTPSNWTATEHIYTGKVYFTLTTPYPSSMRLTLPSNTVAFYFYATTNNTSPRSLTATASGRSLTQTMPAHLGASYYGFYVDSGESLTTVELNSNDGFILGAFGIAKANTLPGSGVTVTDPETGTTISFATITQSGQTTVTTSDPGSTQGPPNGFKVVTTPPTILDISTTAVFEGDITIGINYSQMTFTDESNLRLFHFDEGDGRWRDITIRLDEVNDMIYGTVSSLSAFAVFESTNQTPVANAGSDQTVEGTSPDGALVTLDGSGSTDPDSSPGSNNDDIEFFDWCEGSEWHGDGETLDHTFLPGRHTVTLVVTDFFGETDDDQVIITVEDTTAPEVTVNIENAKVCWDHSDIHVEGKLYLPQGFWMNNLNPVGSTVIELAGAEVTNQSVGFEIAGKKDDKWEYKDKENFHGNLKEFKIDWKGAKFDYKGDDKFHIHTPFIGTETTLCIHTGDVSGAFTVIIDGTTIDYDEERNITTDPPDVDYDPQKDDNTRVRFTLPFELTSEMTIEIEVSGEVVLSIAVADYYEEDFVKFKIVSAFDSSLFQGPGTSPDKLECAISLDDMIAGSDWIESWTDKDDKHWEYKQ